MMDWRDLDDLLEDEELFGDMVQDEQLFDTSRYQRTVAELAKRGSSSRKAMGDKFAPYRDRFAQVHADLASGLRQLKAVEEVENLNRISQKNPIKQGNFYVDKGVMLYVARLYDPETGQDYPASTNRKHKVHVVYENGTENQVWLLSLISSLYDKKRQGQFVTERLEDINLMGEGVTTCHLYIVRYAGEDRRFLDLPNLYKIGVATDLKKRLTGTENQATYLYAPVQLVRSYEVKNLDAHKLEETIHHALADKRVRLTVADAKGRAVEATEWFVVELEAVEQVIGQLLAAIAKD